jgi:hypothetical protein
VKKETVLTAIVFFAVGFLAGYITDAQMNWGARQRSPIAGAVNPQAGMAGGVDTASGASTASGLPEGHPPIDTASLIKAVKEEAERDPKNPAPLLKLANFLYDQRQYSQAIEWYQKALAIDPKNVSARTDLGTAYFYTGRPQDALQQYRQSLQIDPQHGPTLFNSIVVNLEGLHDVAAARQAWEKLHKINPNYPGLDNMKQKLDAERGGSSTP